MIYIHIYPDTDTDTPDTPDDIYINPRTNGRFYFSCPVPSCKRTFKEVGRKLAVHINKIHPDKELIGTTKLSAPELRYARGPALGFKHFSVLSICY